MRMRHTSPEYDVDGSRTLMFFFGHLRAERGCVSLVYWEFVVPCLSPGALLRRGWLWMMLVCSY